MNDGVIRVQGRGELGADPDLVVLEFQARGDAPAYAEAVARASQIVERLRGVFGAEGVPREGLKTTRFQVDPDHEWTDDRARQVFRGYVATHALRVELPRTADAGRVLDAVAREAPGAEVRVSFEIRDRDGFRQRLLAEAVGAALRNAETIARAGGVRLGAIVSIEYGPSEVRFASPVTFHAESRLAAAPTSFEPSEVRGTEVVTVSWAIAQE